MIMIMIEQPISATTRISFLGSLLRRLLCVEGIRHIATGVRGGATAPPPPNVFSLPQEKFGECLL